MKQIKPILAVAVFVFALGASTTSYVGDKENIARLTGEVLTLQKQMRDLQESFDKNSGQSTVLLQKMSDNSETTVRTLAQIEDVMKTTTTVQTNSSTGVNARITKLAEQQGSTDQKLNNISTQINALIRSASRARPRGPPQCSRPGTSTKRPKLRRSVTSAG